MLMNYTLTRGDREIDGVLYFEPQPAQRRSRDCPGCPPCIDDVAFFAADDNEIDLSDDELAEAEPIALRWASACYEAAADDEADRRRQERKDGER